LVILGLWDGIESGAALVVGDRLVAVAHADPLARGVPWQAADEVLARADLSRTDVDLVALAGRYTPPFAVRRHPEWMGTRWRQVAADPFAVARSTGTRWQSVLRRTGLGALEADRATQWFEQRLAEQGFAPRRVILVDIHKALAAAAYRCQPDDDALVLVAHPRGDAALLSLHEGRVGQIDRIALERGSASAHLWLERCMAAAELSDERALFSLAGADPAQRDLGLCVEGGQLVAHAPPLARKDRGPWQALQGLPQDVAASAICGQMRQVVLDWLRPRMRRQAEGPCTLALGGSWARDPRLVAALAELPGVDRVWAGPWLGLSALPLGAALCVGGTSPSLLEPEILAPGREEGALGALGLVRAPREASALARLLARGEGLARLGRGEGAAALVRADDAEAIERVRLALGRPTGETPPVWVSGALSAERAEALAGPLRYGLAAPRISARSVSQLCGVPSGDGRWVLRRGLQPELSLVLDELHASTGCGAVAAFPLGLGAEPAARGLQEAVAVWERAGLPALDLGGDGVIWAGEGA
jgi:hypothetical protein